MIYANWGDRKDTPLVSKLGFGTTRFNTNDLKNETGLNRCIDLVNYAIERGINYFDVAPTYSYGLAEKILGEAFKYNTNHNLYVAAKTGLSIDKTKDDLLRRIDNSLHLLNISQIDFYSIWSIMNIAQYNEILQPGGLYDGALKAKELGLIKHICISLHCDAETVLHIIKDNLFEGITISFNALNYQKWSPVLTEAKKYNLGIATMNSLGGGTIPSYSNLFTNIDNSNDSTAIKALRFVNSFNEISVVLSGMASKEQIDENIKAFENSNAIVNHNFKVETKQALCTGCNYCKPCSVAIPISSCMQAYNHKILSETVSNELKEQELVNDIFICLRANGIDYLSLKQCIACHKCGNKCTQKIDIVKRFNYLKDMSKKYGYTKELIATRLNEIEIECSNSKHIAIWPACDYASRLFDLWDNKEFEDKCEFFNSSPSMWGKRFRNKIVRAPSELEKLNIDTILITHFTLRNEIYNSLKNTVSNKIKLVKVATNHSIDWFNQAIGK